MTMLARNRKGKVHARDCFCCNDGFWGLNWRDRNKKLRRLNRRVEKKEILKEIQEEVQCLHHR